MEEKRNPIWPLIFLTHSAAGLFFAYETPGSLDPDLKADMKFTSHEIGLLYSAYSIPAIASIFTNSYLQKKLGLSKCIVLFSFIIAVGTFIIAIAPNFPVMFAGQLLYGAGSSPMTLTVTTITGKWFGMDAKGKKKVSLAVGLEFAWLRFGSFAALFLLPMIAEAANLRVALGTSALICASSFLSGFVFYIVDTRNKYTVKLFNTTNEEKEMKEVKGEEGEKLEKEKKETKLIQNVYLLSPGGERRIEEKLDEESENGDAILNVKLKKMKEEEEEEDDEVGLVVPDLEKGKNKKQEKEEEEEGKEEKEEKEEKKEGTKEGVKEFINNYYKILRSFSASYWLVVALMVIFMTDLYTCTAFLTDYLYDTKIVSKADRAAQITSFVCLANVLTSPLAGWLSGYTGWKVKYVMLGSINLVFIHCLLTFASTSISPIIMTCALGLTQSIMDTNLWPALVFTVPSAHYPFAMSLCTIAYNIGLIIFPTFCGFLQDVTSSWKSVNIAFILLSSLSVFVAFGLKVADMRNGNVLDYVCKDIDLEEDEKKKNVTFGHH